MTTEPDPAQAEAVDFIRRLTSAWECCATCAGGALAAHDASVRAEAVRETADAVTGSDWPPGFDFPARAMLAKWLHQRATHLADRSEQAREAAANLIAADDSTDKYRLAPALRAHLDSLRPQGFGLLRSPPDGPDPTITGGITADVEAIQPSTEGES